MSLSLRCLAPSASSAEPDLSSFLGGARLTDPEANDPLTWLLPQVPETGSAGVALRPRIAGVPAPRFEREHSPIDLSAWRLGRDRSRWTVGGTARVVAGIAAALPLALVPSLAQAGSKDAPEEPAVETEGLAFGGMDLWTPIIGGVIEVTLGDGVRIKGTLITQSTDELAVILAPDGVLMRVPKELIIGLRVIEGEAAMDADDAAELAELRAIREAIEELREDRVDGKRERIDKKREKEPKSGKALAATGIGLTGAGAGILSVFAIGNAIDSSFAYYTFPMLVIGNGLLGPGIPLMVTGLILEADRKEWEMKREAHGPDVSVHVGPTRGGWAGGLTFRW